jgi:hypothetical protein
MSATTALEPLIRPLIATLGLSSSDAITAVAGGGNNRLYQLQAGGRRFAVKRYHRDPADPRDRFGAEVAFLGIVACHETGDTPQLLASDPQHGMALLDWIEGGAIDRPTDEHLHAAVRFIARINSPAIRQAARVRLGSASQTADSLSAHASGLMARISALRRAFDCPPDMQEMAASMLARLEQEGRLQHIACRSSAEADTTLDDTQRIVSPSDFGFHNVIDRGGTLVFIDFEYAGWDDPAKLVCDFFLQPRVPVPRSALPNFTAGIAAGCRLDRRWLVRRVARLMPLCRLLWSCIALNVLDPVHRQRRLAATGQCDVSALVAKQLALADRYLTPTDE